MRIWFDVDNPPHVHVIRVLSRALEQSGHTSVFTARNRAFTCELLDLNGIVYRKAGGKSSTSLPGKILSTLTRARTLVRLMRDEEVDISFGHGSRALPLASRSLGIPSITMYDYEWVNPWIFNRFCEKILLPEVITRERCRAAGINLHKVEFFPGFKEAIYLSETIPDPKIPDLLSLRDDEINVLLRLPASYAHYHSGQTDSLMSFVLEEILSHENVHLVFLPRTREQLLKAENITGKRVTIPDQVFHGPALLQEFDLVVGAGGTMIREAAQLGIPAYSTFCGKEGSVDRVLAQAGRLVILRDEDDVKEKLLLKKRQPRASHHESSATTEFITHAMTRLVR